MSLPPERITELLALVDALNAGPQYVWVGNTNSINRGSALDLYFAALDPATVQELCAMATRALKLEAAAVLDDHFGYEADYANGVVGWFCRGPKCGQQMGQPHLEDCPVAAALAAAPEPGEVKHG